MAPCLMLLISQWYTKSEQAPRFAIFYTGVGAGQIVGGLISFGFQFVDNPSFPGWRIMFVVMGCVTVLIGLMTLWCIPDSPMAAKFLSDTEKAAVLNHISINQTGIENRHIKMKQVLELLLDPQIWLLMVLLTVVSFWYLSCSVCSPDLTAMTTAVPPVWCHLSIFEHSFEKCRIHTSNLRIVECSIRHCIHHGRSRRGLRCSEHVESLALDHWSDHTRYPRGSAYVIRPKELTWRSPRGNLSDQFADCHASNHLQLGGSERGGPH